MIDTELEEFTLSEALKAGLITAVADGSAKVSGTYEIMPNGETNFEQNNFVFKDKFGVLRVGRFKTERDLVQFILILASGNIADRLNTSTDRNKVSEK